MKTILKRRGACLVEVSVKRGSQDFTEKGMYTCKLKSCQKYSKKQFLPSLAYRCVYYQSVCQGSVQSGMLCHRSYRPILRHTLVFYFPLVSNTNLWMHVRDIYCQALNSFLQTHCKNASQKRTTA